MNKSSTKYYKKTKKVYEKDYERHQNLFEEENTKLNNMVVSVMKIFQKTKAKNS